MQDGTTPVTTGFTLADGTIVAVDANGMITAVTAPVAAAAPIVPGVPAIPGIPAAPAYPAGFEERFAALEKQVADFIAATTPQKFSEQTDAKFQKFSESLTAVIDLVEKFAAQPSDDPAQPPNGNANEIKMSKQERREMLAKNIAERVKA